MTARHGWRGSHPDVLILDEVQVMQLGTVAVDSDGIKNVVIEWPHQSGKRALWRAMSGELTIKFPASQAAARAFNALFAADWARQERMLQRLAADLRIPLSRARQQFWDVVRVLEGADIADGYGRLTIPQPVRPATPWPANLRARRTKGTP